MDEVAEEIGFRWDRRDNGWRGELAHRGTQGSQLPFAQRPNVRRIPDFTKRRSNAQLGNLTEANFNNSCSYQLTHWRRTAPFWQFATGHSACAPSTPNYSGQVLYTNADVATRKGETPYPLDRDWLTPAVLAISYFRIYNFCRASVGVSHPTPAVDKYPRIVAKTLHSTSRIAVLSNVYFTFQHPPTTHCPACTGTGTTPCTSDLATQLLRTQLVQCRDVDCAIRQSSSFASRHYVSPDPEWNGCALRGPDRRGMHP